MSIIQKMYLHCSAFLDIDLQHAFSPVRAVILNSRSLRSGKSFSGRRQCKRDVQKGTK